MSEKLTEYQKLIKKLKQAVKKNDLDSVKSISDKLKKIDKSVPINHTGGGNYKNKKYGQE